MTPATMSVVRLVGVLESNRSIAMVMMMIYWRKLKNPPRPVEKHCRS